MEEHKRVMADRNSTDQDPNLARNQRVSNQPRSLTLTVKSWMDPAVVEEAISEADLKSGSDAGGRCATDQGKPGLHRSGEAKDRILPGNSRDFGGKVERGLARQMETETPAFVRATR